MCHYLLSITHLHRLSGLYYIISCAYYSIKCSESKQMNVCVCKWIKRYRNARTLGVMNVSSVFVCHWCVLSQTCMWRVQEKTQFIRTCILLTSQQTTKHIWLLQRNSWLTCFLCVVSISHDWIQKSHDLCLKHACHWSTMAHQSVLDCLSGCSNVGLYLKEGVTRSAAVP